jgi:hypothetical protein
VVAIVAAFDLLAGDAVMITEANVWIVLLIHVGVILVAAAYYTVGAAMMPRVTARSRERFARRPWLAMLVGVGVSLPWVGVALMLLSLQRPAAGLAGGVLAGLWILAGLTGGAGLAQHVGSAGGSAAWTTTARGGLLLALTWILPLIGWLFMLPLTIATGVGCFLMGLAPQRAPEVVAAV